MVASAIVVASSSLTMYYGVPSIVTIPVGIYVIELGLETVGYFNESLGFSGLGGCGVYLLGDVGCSMFFKDALVFKFSKG